MFEHCEPRTYDDDDMAKIYIHASYYILPTLKSFYACPHYLQVIKGSDKKNPEKT